MQMTSKQQKQEVKYWYQILLKSPTRQHAYKLFTRFQQLFFLFIILLIYLIYCCLPSV
uniref:Uncharacterized protein n=1 Tax=Glycine max TaxID=3847 RepID=C6T1G8_SOYBN|nr:unknown [Glycine max]